MDLNESWTYGSPPIQGRRRAEAGAKAKKEVSVPYAAQAAAGPALPWMWQQYASKKAWHMQAKPAAPWVAAPMPWCAVPAEWGAMPGPWGGMPGAWSGLPGAWAGGPGPWGFGPAPCAALPAPCGAAQVSWPKASAAWQGVPVPYGRQAAKQWGVGPYARSTLAVDAAAGLDAHTDPMQP